MVFALGYLTMMTACRETQTGYIIWRPHGSQYKYKSKWRPWSYIKNKKLFRIRASLPVGSPSIRYYLHRFVSIVYAVKCRSRLLSTDDHPSVDVDLEYDRF